MATAPEEMADLSRVTGSLLVNFGTIQNLDGMLAAGAFLPTSHVITTPSRVASRLDADAPPVVRIADTCSVALPQAGTQTSTANRSSLIPSESAPLRIVGNLPMVCPS